ncbi:siderophore-interacting protein [Nonomuraea insulae]|uniref:Siderophore-interacting protein n=1 Tax=Nonomuraea insulae TaxID=1616787 RepID=A0ABW1DBM9_9ACTN
MATESTRRAPQCTTGVVLRSEQISPHMLRIVLGGDGLAGFGAGEFTDHYVKLLFPVPGVDYPEPFDMGVIRAELPREDWPKTRTYTVRSWDPESGELAIDFVCHGDQGLAGPWAMGARPGDVLRFLGPGGAYTPSAEADWHLLVGDESALPAIGAAMARIPAGVPARVFVEVADRAERQDLPTACDAEIVWLHRDGAPVGQALVDAVREVKFLDGTVHAFVHGEATFVKELRRHLRVERELPLEWLSISGYWRRGRDEDGWQSSKRDWNREIEEEEAKALSTGT